MSTKSVAILNYDVGNIRSVANAFEYLGCNVDVVDDAQPLRAAHGIVLPGVGAFGTAMDSLHSRNLVEPLNEIVIENKRPILGICLGMQIMSQSSDENGRHSGLGWILGEVKELQVNDGLRLPHVGWNTINMNRDCLLFDGFREEPVCYFNHSFGLLGASGAVVAETEYGQPITAAIEHGNIFGVQFHPERSQAPGLSILKNFIKQI